jgi:ferric-dicitrate binding protein FerR (iron transport regulator)
MTKPSLSGIFRHASASHDSGIAADDVARVAAGERLGARHDAVVEALAGSPAGLLAYRALRDSHAQIQALVAGEQVVTAMPARVPARRTWRPGFAMAAGAMGVALLAGLMFRAGPEPQVDRAATTATAAALDDVIFSVSYESDGAIVATSSGEEPIFIDEFGG